MHFSSTCSLNYQLCQQLIRQPYQMRIYFSGRSALYALALHLKDKMPGRRVLMPDYICNVVYVALEKAGLECVPFPSDDQFELNEKSLLDMLDKHRPGLLLTAGLYGSSAGLPLLNQPHIRKLLVRRNIRVIIDACQDIHLINHLPGEYGSHLTAVVSFNNKSFPGIMGGAILSTEAFPEPQKEMPLRLKWRLYRILLMRWRRRLSGRPLNSENTAVTNEQDEYEYSHCREFPWHIVNWRPAKIQLIMAIIGLKKLPEIDRRKAAALAGIPGIRQFPFVSTAAYWLIPDQPLPVDRKIKRPYAKPDDQGASLHPEMKAVYSEVFE